MQQSPTLSKETLQDNLTYLQELQTHQGQLLVATRLRALLEQAQRQLETSVESSLVFRAQGEVMAYRKAMSAIDDLMDSIKRNLETL